MTGKLNVKVSGDWKVKTLRECGLLRAIKGEMETSREEAGFRYDCVGVREGGLDWQMAPGAALSLRRLQGMDGLRGPGRNGF